MVTLHCALCNVAVASYLALLQVCGKILQPHDEGGDSISVRRQVGLHSHQVAGRMLEKGMSTS